MPENKLTLISNVQIPVYAQNKSALMFVPRSVASTSSWILVLLLYMVVTRCILQSSWTAHDYFNLS